VTRVMGRVGAVVAAVLIAATAQGVAHAGTVRPDSDFLVHDVVGAGVQPAVLSPYGRGITTQ
jgi:hypothetical protein